MKEKEVKDDYHNDWIVRVVKFLCKLMMTKSEEVNKK